jgi:putative resolvase
VIRVFKEIGLEVNDNRAMFLTLFEDQRIGTIVVEHRDRATSFSFRYLDTLLKVQGRTREVANQADNNREELLTHLVSMEYRFAVRLHGPRRAKFKTTTIMKQLQEADE